MTGYQKDMDFYSPTNCFTNDRLSSFQPESIKSGYRTDPAVFLYGFAWVRAFVQFLKGKN